MQSITNNIARVAGTALAVFAMLTINVALAPKAHATDLDVPSYDNVTFYPDQYATFYPDQTTTFYPDQFETFYPDQYGYDYGYGYGSGFSSGCGSSCGGGFGGSGFSGMGGFGGGRSSVVSTAAANTSIYAPTNTNTCTAPNTCNTSYDDHSIFNAPTTVTVSGGGNSSYPVYIPVQQPQYPVYNTPIYPNYPTVYPQPVRQPYVSLNQVPYTGLDLGPVGTVLYWSFLVFWVLLAAYLIVYKRVQTKLVSGLNSFLFGSTALTTGGAPAGVGTHAKVVHPAKASYSDARPTNPADSFREDAIDPFIASQISRNK